MAAEIVLAAVEVAAAEGGIGLETGLGEAEGDLSHRWRIVLDVVCHDPQASATNPEVRA